MVLVKTDHVMCYTAINILVVLKIYNVLLCFILQELFVNIGTRRDGTGHQNAEQNNKL